MPSVNEKFVDLTLSDILDDDLDKEHKGKVKKIRFDDGNHIWIESVDPYGYWKVKLRKGKLPDFIRENSYTTFRDALTDINRWLRTRQYNIVYPSPKQDISREE